MFKIIENAIPLPFQNHIEDVIKRSSWIWHDETSYALEDPERNRSIQIKKNNTDIQDLGQMTCPFLDQGKIYSENFNFLLPVLYMYADSANINVNELVRVRANLLFQDKTYDKNWYNFPHTDYGKYSFIYYVNDSDGDTFLFEEFEKNILPERYNIWKRVPPKKGRGLFFESQRYHSSSNPANSKLRLVINFNFN